MSNKLTFFLSTANDIDNLFDEYLNNLHGNVDETKNKIEREFAMIVEQLNERKIQLKEEMDEWEKNKMQEIKQEKTDIMQYKNKIDKNILNNKEYKKYQKTREISKLIQNVMTHSDIIFEPEIQCKNIKSFGNIESNFNDNDTFFKLPILTLSAPIKREEEGESVADGYTIRLQWKFNAYSMDSKQKQTRDFIIKYQVLTDGGNYNDDEDEKKKNPDKTGDDDLIYWETLKYDKIECLDSNEIFAVNIRDKTFSLNRKYLFRIECMIEIPMHLNIISNVEGICIDIDDGPKGNINEIKLKCVQHRADNNGPPSNILKTDDSYYWSAMTNNFNKGDNDWIEFEFELNDDEINKNITYFPTTFKILNHSGYQKQGIKNMNISIGNKKNNEWYEYNEGGDPFIIQKIDEIQSFHIYGINSKIIKNKQLTCIRLEFVTNWGFKHDFGSKYACRQFNLYGIKF